jgi:hypothetical protein
MHLQFGKDTRTGKLLSAGRFTAYRRPQAAEERVRRQRRFQRFHFLL